MSEILVQRIINRENLSKILKDENIIFTDDEDLICNMYDVKSFLLDSELELYIDNHKNYFNKNKELEAKIREAFKKNQRVAHKDFSSDRIQSQLKEFTSQKENSELSSECIWNVTLFYTQLTQYFYKPVISRLIGFIGNLDLEKLHSNIQKFVEDYFKKEKVLYGVQFHALGIFSQDEWIILNKEKHSVSLSGVLSFFKPDTNELFEIKASQLDTYSEEWLIQTLSYALFLDVYNIKVKTIYIVNILKGKCKKNFLNWILIIFIL